MPPYNRDKWDVHLTDVDGNTLGLKYARGGRPSQPARVASQFGPWGDGSNTAQRELVVQNDWSGGYGYSDRIGRLANTYAWGINADSRTPGMIGPAGAITEVSLASLPAPIATGAQYVTSSAVFGSNNDLYFSAGRYIFKIAAGTATTPTLVYTASAGIDFIVSLTVWEGKLYAGVGTGGFSRLLVSADGAAWTEYTGVPVSFLGAADWETTVSTGTTIGTHLIGTWSFYTLRSCPPGKDPTDPANWGPVINVGGGTARIRALRGSPRRLFALTTLGTFDIDNRGRAVLTTPYWQFDENNGWDGMYYDGLMLASNTQGIDGVDVVSGTRHYQGQWLLPGHQAGIPNRTPIFGRPMGFTQESGWAVTSVYSGTASYVLYGKSRAALAEQGINAPGPGPWVWHGALASTPNEWITHLTTTPDPSGNQRLWMASAAGSGIKLRWQLCAKMESPYQQWLYGATPGSFSFSNSWSVVFSDITSDGARLNLERYTVSAENTGTLDNQLVIKARTTRSGAFATQATLDTESERFTFVPSGELRAGYRLGMLVEGTNAANSPIWLTEVTRRVRRTVEQQQQIQYTIDADWNQSTGRGKDRRDQDEVLAALVAMQRSPEPLTIREGTKTYQGTIDGIPRMEKVEDAQGKPWLNRAVFLVTKLEES